MAADPESPDPEDAEEGPPPGSGRAEKALWARRGLLEWYVDLGLRGRLRLGGAVLLVVNGCCYLMGFILWKILCFGAGLVLISFLLPGSVDD